MSGVLTARASAPIKYGFDSYNGTVAGMEGLVVGLGQGNVSCLERFRRMTEYEGRASVVVCRRVYEKYEAPLLSFCLQKKLGPTVGCGPFMAIHRVDPPGVCVTEPSLVGPKAFYNEGVTCMDAPACGLAFTLLRKYAVAFILCVDKDNEASVIPVRVGDRWHTEVRLACWLLTRGRLAGFQEIEEFLADSGVTPAQWQALLGLYRIK